MPHQATISPIELERRRNPRPPVPPTHAAPGQRPVIAREVDPVGVREWIGHLDAGRIGVAPPPPVAGGGDYRCASLERLLGRTGAGR